MRWLSPHTKREGFDAMQNLTVVFDLDGTLVETAPDLIAATNHVMRRAGLAPVPAAHIRPSISFGARAMIEKGLQFHARSLPNVEIDRLLQLFLAHYAENIAVESHAYPGLETALETLAARGATLAVCTNKQHALSRRLLDALGLSRHFKALAGRDTFPVCKPHPDHLTGAIAMAGGDAQRAIMVGDSETDIKTARAAGIPVIGVPFGYTDIPIHELKPDAVITHYRELETAIAALSRR